jgi:hypothetical protein
MSFRIIRLKLCGFAELSLGGTIAPCLIIRPAAVETSLLGRIRTPATAPHKSAGKRNGRENNQKSAPEGRVEALRTHSFARGPRDSIRSHRKLRNSNSGARLVGIKTTITKAALGALVIHSNLIVAVQPGKRGAFSFWLDHRSDFLITLRPGHPRTARHSPTLAFNRLRFNLLHSVHVATLGPPECHTPDRSAERRSPVSGKQDRAFILVP